MAQLSPDKRHWRRYSLLALSLAAAIVPLSASAAVIVRETAGTQNISDKAGNTWESTQNFAGGWRWEGYAGDIANTDDDAVYRPEIAFFDRWSRQLPNGKYKVTVKMREQWANAAGARVFAVAAEGQVISDSVDIFKAVGKNAAHDLVFTTEVKDGKLDLGFAASKDTPSIAAIQVETVDGPEQPSNAIRVSVLPTSIKDSSGATWEAASGFSGGTFWAGDPNADIAGTNDDVLYRPEMYGMTGWSRTLNNGNYEVTLKMREGWFGTNGQRVFNVSAEGAAQLTNLDIHAEAGKNKALDKSFVVKVADGRLDLGFSASANNPILSAIMVKPTSIDPPEPPKPTGGFTTQGTKIIGPDGKEFISIGANVGVAASFEGNGTNMDNSQAYQAVLDWKWNTLRFNFLVTDFICYAVKAPYRPGQKCSGRGWSDEQFLQYIDGFVQKYTAQKVVVVIASHDALGAAYCKVAGDPCIKHTMNAPYMAKEHKFWIDAANRYKNNPYVWFNIDNEPPSINEEYKQIQEYHLKAIRDAGANNIVVIDAPTAGQDIGDAWGGNPHKKFGYESDMIPDLAKRYKHVVYAQHNYGGLYDNSQKLDQYINNVLGSGMPLIFGEFGWTTDGSSTAGSYSQNHAGGLAVLDRAQQRKIGMWVWHGTHNDKYSVKSNSGPFWDGGAGNGLSELGQKFWNITH